MFPSKQDKKKGTTPSVVHIKDDKMYIDDELWGTIRLDAKKLPKLFDITFEKAGTPGIYKFEKGTLLICWSSRCKRRYGRAAQRIQDGQRETPEDRMLTLKRAPK